MNELIEITFWVAINETGDFVVNLDGASDAHAELEGSFTNEASRVVQVTLKLPAPKVAEVQATLPEGDGPVDLAVKA